MPAITECIVSVNDPLPGQPSVHGNAATPNDESPATRSAMRGARPHAGATTRHPRPKATIPDVTINRLGAPISASLLIAS